MTVNSWVFLFFRLLNFLILLGIAIYLICKKLKPLISGAIARKKSEDMSLQADVKNEQQRVKNLDNKIIDRRKRLERLAANVERWQHDVGEQHTKLRSQFKLLEEQFSEDLAERRQFVKEQSERKAVGPILFEAVQSDLVQYYTSSEHQGAYIDKVLNKCEVSES